MLIPLPGEQVALKVADLGHTAATERVHLDWTKRLEAEFYTQGDRERDLGLKISPLMDRNSIQTGISKSQVLAAALSPSTSCTRTSSWATQSEASILACNFPRCMLEKNPSHVFQIPVHPFGLFIVAWF